MVRVPDLQSGDSEFKSRDPDHPLHLFQVLALVQPLSCTVGILNLFISVVCSIGPEKRQRGEVTLISISCGLNLVLGQNL